MLKVGRIIYQLSTIGKYDIVRVRWFYSPNFRRIAGNM